VSARDPGRSPVRDAERDTLESVQRPSGLVPRGTYRDAVESIPPRESHSRDLRDRNAELTGAQRGKPEQAREQAAEEEFEEESNGVRVSMRVPKGSAPTAEAESASASTRESQDVSKPAAAAIAQAAPSNPAAARAHTSREAEFFSSGSAVASVWQAEDWSELDDQAIAQRTREAHARQLRRAKYQQRVLYAVTAAACFTALGLTVELYRQQGRELEVATAARLLSVQQQEPAAAAAPAAAPAPQPQAVEAVNNAPPLPVEPAVAADVPVTEMVISNIVGAEEPAAAAQPVAVAPPAAKPAAIPNAGAPGAAAPVAAAKAAPQALATPAPVAKAPVAVAKAFNGNAGTAKGVTQPSVGAAAPAQGKISYSESDGVGTAEIKREVRPAQPSEKPPTKSFPAVN
jgi:ribonuclease E